MSHCVLKDYLLAVLTHGERNKKVNKIKTEIRGNSHNISHPKTSAGLWDMDQEGLHFFTRRNKEKTV
jgi:hypothetical protein